MAADLKAPVRFSPSVEKPAPDERETIDGLKEQFQSILETTSKDYAHAVRAVHAKSHALLEGELTIAGNLPPELAQGMFARGGTHKALVRISTNAGDVLDDIIALPRGLALKVLDVEGERLSGAEGTTQDFIMVNGPAFAAPDPKKFLGNLKLLAKTTDKAEWAKKAISGVLRAAEATLEAVGTESAMLKTMGGAPNVNPLGETYYSQTPFRYGDLIAKFQLAPVSSNLTAVTGENVLADGRPDAIREEVGSVMSQGEGVWELRVQLCRDLESMPIEDASVEWKEEDSPFHTVATLRVPAQVSWSLDKAEVLDDATRFSIWTGLAAHQPLGGVNRARNDTYSMSADFRSRFNGCPIHEPSAAAA